MSAARIISIRRRSPRRGLAAALVAAVVVVALAAGVRVERHAPLTHASAAPTGSSAGEAAPSGAAIAANGSIGVQAPSSTLALDAAAPAASGVMSANEPRAAVLDRLARGTPAERFEAYRVLQACWAARMVQTLPQPLRQDHDPSVVDACAGLLGGQETMRLPLLADALRASVPEAAEALRTAWEIGDRDHARFEGEYGAAIDAYAAAGNAWAVAFRSAHDAAAGESSRATSVLPGRQP